MSFPWSMIDKITPRPAESVEKKLAGRDIEKISPIITSKNVAAPEPPAALIFSSDTVLQIVPAGGFIGKIIPVEGVCNGLPFPELRVQLHVNQGTSDRAVAEPHLDLEEIDRKSTV